MLYFNKKSYFFSESSVYDLCNLLYKFLCRESRVYKGIYMILIKFYSVVVHTFSILIFRRPFLYPLFTNVLTKKFLLVFSEISFLLPFESEIVLILQKTNLLSQFFYFSIPCLTHFSKCYVIDNFLNLYNFSLIILYFRTNELSLTVFYTDPKSYFSCIFTGYSCSFEGLW